MKKTKLFLIIITNISVAFSQNFITSFPVQIKKKEIVLYNYVDKSKDESYFFVSNNRNIKAVNYDKEFNVIDSISINKPNEIFENIAGLNISNENVNVFWISDKNNQIINQQLNFKTKAINSKIYTFNFENQKILQSFSTNNFFYLLTIAKNSNVLKFIVFDTLGGFKEQTVDLGKTSFFTSQQKLTTLYEVLGENLKPLQDSYELPIIDNNSLVSLTLSSKKRKCYFNTNEIYITIDTNVNFTQLIKIDLTTFIATCKNLNNPYLEKEEGQVIKSNSLVVNDKLYQVNATTTKINFSISNFDGKEVQNFSGNDKQDISFKNSKYYYEEVNPLNETSKKITKASQFLNKLSDLNIGIVNYSLNDKNLVTIGGISKHYNKQDKEAQSFLSNYGLIGALIYVSFYNQNITNFDFSRDVASFYVNLNSDYTRDNIDVNLYALDSVKSFFINNPNAIYPTITTNKNNHYIGFYNVNNKQYSFLKYSK